MNDDLASLTPNLASLGWSDAHSEWADGFDAGLTRGRVARVSRGFSLVFTGGEAVLVASASIRAQHERAPATGDYVLVDPSGEDGPVIAAIAQRSTELARRAPGRIPEAQVLVTNVDQIFVMHGLDREVSLRRIERQLVVAWQSGAQPVIILTKADTLDAASGELEKRIAEVASIAGDAPLIAVSTVSGRGIEDISARLTVGRSAAMLGLSGIGKSTLVNALTDGIVQRTGEVRATDQKGRHTTVTRDLIPLPGAGMLVDTPGIREIGLWQADDGLAATFPEIASVVDTCRFADCAHDQEPDCAIRSAIADGRIAPRRLEHWRQLSDELDLQDQQLEEFDRRSEARDLAEAERRRDQERSNTKRRGKASRKRRKR